MSYIIPQGKREEHKNVATQTIFDPQISESHIFRERGNHQINDTSCLIQRSVTFQLKYRASFNNI